MHVVEAADAHGMNRGLAAARHHHGRVAAGDDVHGLADGVKAVEQAVTWAMFGPLRFFMIASWPRSC